MPSTPNPNDSEKAPHASPPSGKSLLPGLNRTRAMGSSGLAAASAGWVLVGCIAFGFGVGTWLDTKFGTSYWMPILVLVGVAAGFRELFVMVAQVSKHPTPKAKHSALSDPNAPLSVSTEQKTKAVATKPEAPQETERKRLFEVPAPPTASFDKTAATTKVEVAMPTPSQDEVMRALMQDEDETENKSDKSQ